MSGRNLAYLDLSALPAVGAAMLSARPSFVWAADGRRVLWANAAGAAFFGAADIETLLQRHFSETLPATTQIARFARALPQGATRLERISFATGGRLQSLSAACTRMALPDGGNAVLIALDAPRAARLSLVEQAERLADALAAEDCLVAILDASGDVIAASGGLDALAAAEGAIDGLVAGIGRSPDRLVKRAIRVEDDRRPAGVARFEQDGKDFHLLIVGPAERVVLEAAPATEASPDRTAPEFVEAVAPMPVAAVPLQEASIEAPAVAGEVVPPVAEPTPMIEVVPEPIAETSTIAVEPLVAEAPGPVAIAEDAPEARNPMSMADIVEAVSDANVAVGRRDGTDPAGLPVSDAQLSTPDEVLPEPVVVADAEAAFRFVPPTGPVRFVFQMDAAGRFSFVSPEFEVVVGPRSAAIVGASWGDVAAARGLDEKGAIAALIARRDTWSGATLSWPVDGTVQRVAVDLAALPAFSRDRAFEGYRGFGVIRPAELRREPPAPLEEKRSTVIAMPRTPPKAPPAAEPSNVVHLPRPTASPGDVERLSMPEQDAFRRIAVALGAKVSGDAAPASAAPETTPVGEASAAGDATATVPAIDAPAPESETAEVQVTETAEIALSPEITQPTEALPADVSDEVVPVIAEAVPAEPIPVGEAAAPDQDLAHVTAADASVVPVVEPLAAEAATVEMPAASEPVVLVEPAPAPAPAVDRQLVADLAAAGHKIAELEAILDTATDGVAVVDAEGRIVRINRSAEALFGVETLDVAGLPFTHLLAEESRKSALDYLEGLAQNGVASLLNDGREVIGRVPQGGLIPLFMTMGRLGETGKFCAVLRDITQWKNAEEELINARRAAETASMQKSDFLAKISHEIRTPLNAIIGFSEVMMEERFGPIGTQRYKEYLRDIHVSGAHLMSLLNDLLDLSKIEAGKMDLNFEAVALNEIVMECVALMQPQANRERIIIRTSLSSQVPSIVADPRSIRQIVLNLVSNAIKFTLAGGQVIVSTALEERGEVTLRIRDTGIGMSEKDVETALKPFRQVATSAKHRSDGTGLGLPLTKALVEANRAAFTIDSAVGQGTLIRVTFPATRVLVG